MFQSLAQYLQIEAVVTVFAGLAAFAAVLGFAAPLLQKDPLKIRLQAVSAERERLRSEQRAQLLGERRLRERPQASLAQQIVDSFDLKRLLETDGSRQFLRQAGLRSERHLVSFLAARAVGPFAIAFLIFLYTSTIYANQVPPPMRLLAAGVGLAAGFYVPLVFVQNLIARRQESIRRSWSDALDLMLICVESGMAIEPAMQRVAREIGSVSVPLAEELTLTVAELSYLQDRRKAFENLGKRTGMSEVKSVVTSLVQSERYGTPMATALRVLAQENRDMRMALAEKKAAALPPRLTVPMIVFFLPAIFVVILGPAVLMLSKLF